MIIWLASYPKSGNTWLRTIVHQLLFAKNTKENKVFEGLDLITSYPQIKHFENISKKITDSELKDHEEVIKNWTISQDAINLDKKIKFFKTHNFACKKYNESDKKNYSFTDLNNSLGVMYIVRDPRNVITSLKHHFHLEDYDKAFKMMENEKWWLGVDELNPIPQALSSWDNHFESWNRFPKNFLLIKYEDLLTNTKDEIKKIIQYLNKFFDIKENNELINTIIKNTSFANLKKQEEEQGFSESVLNKKKDKKKKFFNLGPKNKWINYLDEEMINKIEKRFGPTMKKLGYLI
jgi:pterin-4a-carbinolamine dehydratase